MHVVIAETMDESALTLLEGVATYHYEPGLHAKTELLKTALGGADVLVVRNQTQVNADLLEQADRLKLVGRLGVGLDNLDMAVLRERGIMVSWAVGSNAVSVAEYVMGVMLEFSKRFAETSARLHAGAWDRQAAIGGELYAKTLGIIGLGDIGSRLALRARAFGMQVVAYDPLVHDNTLAVQDLSVQLLSLDELLTCADFVSLHVPLLPATRGLMSAERLAQLKPSAVLINTARGGLVDEQALAEALRAGSLAGAALDVRETEPPTTPDPLQGSPNLILTPHVAGVTRESNRRTSFQVMQDVVRVLRGQPPLCKAPGSA